MHGWLYVEMASLFVSRIVAQGCDGLSVPGHSLLSFFLSERHVGSSGLI
jgi:hypothetical protein